MDMQQIFLWPYLQGHWGTPTIWEFEWAMSWDYGTFRPPKTHSSHAHAQPSSWARCLIFGRTLRLLPTSRVRIAKALVRLRGCAGSPEPSLVAYNCVSWLVCSRIEVPSLINVIFKIPNLRQVPSSVNYFSVVCFCCHITFKSTNNIISQRNSFKCNMRKPC